jgi:hypothetical protein
VFAATTLRSATLSVPITPSTGARTLSSSTRRCASATTRRWRSSSLTRVLVSSATSLISSCEAWPACLARICADFSASCARR